jgi:hypothetical protein
VSFIVTVVPGAAGPVSWGELRAALARQPSTATTIAPLRDGDETAFSDSDVIEPETYYRFTGRALSDLWLFMLLNQRVRLDEVEYLDEYAVNVSVDQRRRMAAAWAAAGHYYLLISGPDRSDEDISALIAAAAALAELRAGHVLVTDNTWLDCPRGVFTADRFRRVQPSVPTWKP